MSSIKLETYSAKRKSLRLYGKKIYMRNPQKFFTYGSHQNALHHINAYSYVKSYPPSILHRIAIALRASCCFTVW